MNSPKKDQLYEILEGRREMPSPLIERSSLVAVAESPPPEFPSPKPIWSVGLPVILALAALAVALRHLLTSPVILAATISSLVAAFVGLCVWSSSSRREIGAVAQSLRGPLRELEDMLQYLQSYQAELDRRTSRYFHCVTNTKVTSYFIISQITIALRERIEQIRELVAEPNPENIRNAFELFSRKLSFRDSMSQASGRVHLVSLGRLKGTVIQLIEFIDHEIEILEHELGITKNTSQADNEFTPPLADAAAGNKE